jgi:hypothetical protein
MSTKVFLYGIWCVGIILASLATSYYAWSPFADGNGRAARAGLYGPTHK